MWCMALMEKLDRLLIHFWARNTSRVIRMAITLMAEAKLWLTLVSPTYCL